jgi:hypothetical protein
MLPKAVYLDFEKALADGFVKVFPGATPMKDFFHFMQANARKVKGDLKLEKYERTAIRDALKILWHKPTKAKFDTCLQALLSRWDRRIPQYSAYFRLTWLNLNPPTVWVSYARPKDARSGNQLTPFRTFLFLFL